MFPLVPPKKQQKTKTITPPIPRRRRDRAGIGKANSIYVIYGRSAMNAHMLEVSLLAVGTVLRLERDARSMVKMTREINKRVRPPLPPPNPPIFVTFGVFLFCFFCPDYLEVIFRPFPILIQIPNRLFLIFLPTHFPIFVAHVYCSTTHLVYNTFSYIFLCVCSFIFSSASNLLSAQYCKDIGRRHKSVPCFSSCRRRHIVRILRGDTKVSHVFSSCRRRHIVRVLGGDTECPMFFLPAVDAIL